MEETLYRNLNESKLQELVDVRLLIARHFSAYDFIIADRSIRFSVSELKSPFRRVREDFAKFGYFPFLRRRGNHRECVLIKPRHGIREHGINEIITPAVLFILTIITTTMAGYFFTQPMVEHGFIRNIWAGCVSFSAALIFILGCHEMGHKITSIRYGIDASMPYFIPLPSLAMFGSEFITLGTLGAVIRVRSPMPDDNASVDMGINGPIAGFIAALPVAIIGVLLSRPVNMQPLAEGGAILSFGEPLILKAIIWMFKHPSENMTMVWHPFVYASWVGFLVTSLNLIPVGQLDGGHIARAVLGRRRFRVLSWSIVVSLFALGFLWYGWWLWSVIGALLTLRGYPRVMNEFESVSPVKRWKAIIALILFILCFMPSPVGFYINQ
ncbi:MAG: site-2 protease family protein [bacterium]